MARNEFRRHKVGDTIKWIITLLVGLALIGGMVTLFVKLDRQTSTTTIGGEAYSVGTLDETGEYAEASNAIYLRNAVSVDGLKCTLANDATVTYQLFFYDGDGKYLSATETLTADWSGTAPEGAASARVLIIPLSDEDNNISFTELWGYASQVTVTVNR